MLNISKKKYAFQQEEITLAKILKINNCPYVPVSSNTVSIPADKTYNCTDLF